MVQVTGVPSCDMKDYDYFELLRGQDHVIKVTSREVNKTVQNVIYKHHFYVFFLGEKLNAIFLY